MADRVLEWMLYIGSEYMLDRIVEWSLMGGHSRKIYRNGEGKEIYKKKIK
jgi:hypothetical protein